MYMYIYVYDLPLSEISGSSQELYTLLVFLERVQELHFNISCTIDMAPSLEVRYESAAPAPSKSVKSILSYTPGRTTVQTHENYAHEDLKPYFPEKHWAPLEEVPYIEKGLLGSPTFDDLLSNATKVFDYNPKIGTEIEGVDLANLTDAAKNDLARLISIRGVVFFRNQKNLTVDAQRELGCYFGTLHKHATTSVPKRGDLDDVHVVYNDQNSKDQRSLFTPTFLWHADVCMLV